MSYSVPGLKEDFKLFFNKILSDVFFLCCTLFQCHKDKKYVMVSITLSALEYNLDDHCLSDECYGS